MLAGGCYCGAVRYEAGGEPYHQNVCHCSDCRRTTGAPLVAWFTVARDAFRVVRGEPRAFASSDHGTRYFCPTCGTQLAFMSTRYPGEADVTTASLDDPGAQPPVDQSWRDERVAWVDGVPGLRGFARGRT